ncbi:hypothetical protein C8R48DRAFT_773484 [Suillus tomentosus]|nr:hypothetical protein C8R48DRAFT_773484 [Suillus tomentosus]
MPVVVSDDESASAHIVSRPRRTVTLSSRLTDANNDATPELSIHRNKPPPPAITQKSAQLSSKRAADFIGSLSADECAPDEGVMEDGPHESKRLRHAVANTRADTSFDVLTDTQSTAPVEMHSGPGLGPSQAQAFWKGLTWVLTKPKPSKARPKPGLSGQARPGTSLRKYLVRWLGFGADEDEWLPRRDLEDCEALDAWEQQKKAS